MKFGPDRSLKTSVSWLAEMLDFDPKRFVGIQVDKKNGIITVELEQPMTSITLRQKARSLKTSVSVSWLAEMLDFDPKRFVGIQVDKKNGIITVELEPNGATAKRP